MIQSVNFTSVVFEAFDKAHLCFLALAKNAEVIKSSHEKINQC